MSPAPCRFRIRTMRTLADVPYPVGDGAIHEEGEEDDEDHVRHKAEALDVAAGGQGWGDDRELELAPQGCPSEEVIGKKRRSTN